MKPYRLVRTLVLGAGILPFAGCSESSVEDASGGSAGSAGASSLGGGAGDGGSASSAGAGAGDAGALGMPDGGRAGLPDDCAAIIDLEPGRNYGEYSLFALRIDLGLAPGAYVPYGDHAGSVRVFGEDGELVDEVPYDRNASLADNALQTVALPGLFELDLRSQTQADLSGLDDSIFDGCHRVVADAGTAIRATQVYDAILVEAVTPDPAAPSGTYTLFSSSGNAGQVALRRDGSAVTTLDYDWMASIGGGASFTFDFPDLLSLTVTRATGTSNLFPVAASLFDGRHEIVVP